MRGYILAWAHRTDIHDSTSKPPSSSATGPARTHPPRATLGPSICAASPLSVSPTDASTPGLCTLALHAGLPVITGVITHADTTESTSKTTGAIKTAGGMGIAKNIHVGGTADVTGNAEITGGKSVAGGESAARGGGRNGHDRRRSGFFRRCAGRTRQAARGERRCRSGGEQRKRQQLEWEEHFATSPPQRGARGRHLRN